MDCLHPPIAYWTLHWDFDFDDNGAYTLSLELTNQHIFDWDSGIFVSRRDETQLYATWNRQLYNDTVTLEYIASYHLGNKEHFHRLRWAYDWTNQITVELQADFFEAQNEQTLLGQLEGKHRVSALISFDF